MRVSAVSLLFKLCAFVVKLFFGGLWQGTAFIVAVSCCLRLLRRLKASSRFALCGIAFILALLMPLLDATDFKPASPYSSSHVFRLSLRFGLVLAATWILLSLWRLVQLLQQGRALVGVWRRAIPIDLASYGLETIKHFERNLEICTSTEVGAPSLIGFLRPRLLIPTWMLGELTATDLLHVAMHESEHLRRYDDWLNLLQKTALVLFPLNPALLWFDKKLRLERELACDDHVAEMSNGPFEYARCLVRLTEFGAARRRFELALHAWERQSELAYRIHALLAPVRRISSRQARISITLLSISLLGMAVGFWRVPAIVCIEGLAVNEPPKLATLVLPEAHSDPPMLSLAGFSTRKHPAFQRVSLASRLVKRHQPRKQTAERETVDFALASMVTTSRDQRFHLELAGAEGGVVGHSADKTSGSTVPDELFVPLIYTPTCAAMPLRSGWLIIQL